MTPDARPSGALPGGDEPLALSPRADGPAGVSLFHSQRPRGFYVRLLRLRRVRPTGWQLFLLNEGSLIVALLLVLADLATAWTLLVLPLVIALAVKFTDVLVGALPDQRRPSGPPPDRRGG